MKMMQFTLKNMKTNPEVNIAIHSNECKTSSSTLCLPECKHLRKTDSFKYLGIMLEKN